MRLQGMLGRKPDCSDHVGAERRVQYGEKNPSSVPAETRRGALVRKSATVQ